MKTYKLHRENGRFFAFEIENAYIQPKKIAQLLSAVDGVTDIKRGKLLSSSEVRVQFKFESEDFIVWEPFGDNSRYWIGLDNDDDSLNIDITSIEEVFKNYKPQLLVKVFGDLISLNFKAIFGKD